MGRTAVVALAITLPLASALGVGTAAGLDDAVAAWLASLDEEQRGEALYDLADGERFDLRRADADHVHAVLREFDGDSGRDLLAEHHARHHGRPLAALR